MRLFYRFQPPGLPLRGHRSGASDEGLLPRGFVFAYDTPNEAMAQEGPFGGWAENVEDLEVVTFTGTQAHNPGDVEGLAVRPNRVIRRETPWDWVQRMRRHRSSSVRDYARKTAEYLSHRRAYRE